MPIRVLSLMADRLMAAKINRKVELANDDMMVRSVVFTNRSVMTVCQWESESVPIMGE